MKTDQWSHFSVTADDERLWRVTFDNPPINLVTPEMLVELPELIDEMTAARELRVVVFDSANPHYFLNHYDTSRVAETPKDLGVTGYPLTIDTSTRLTHLPVASIAKIRGRVRGIGSELTLAMDMRFASERALFGQPETASGNLPGGGGLEHLPRLMGRARALEVALSSDDYPGQLAERYGWVNRAVDDKDLDTFVDTLAHRIASYDKESIAAVKQQINRHTAPSPEDMLSSLEIYMSSFQWPGSKRRSAAALAAGRNQPGDYEMRMGHHLGRPLDTDT
ncbi:enoyl-CoA hydratase/isomerase family protein [Mycolicibacterium confluentis]|uniref:Enoyl-CoA hydratase n=1 Tax=Mycolicibacterium confluentis TaxID=28047 RepID=A0A7I7XWH1_9MYCO|nr:enoyl-CoA hydratase/isomerase family protein [Mycolicibacterium confluentis]MCV7321815.1 enoyl-CoA hydratase/isomerase family protein [Mycolicibacterium confluentis]ORV32075.1 enoyl-CoA hydratase [Mycolicibacterium confluentis]BBZ33628.1 enoyl-CoA hydratase [Mycolicibacterium confluentis]